MRGLLLKVAEATVAKCKAATGFSEGAQEAIERRVKAAGIVDDILAKSRCECCGRTGPHTQEECVSTPLSEPTRTGPWHAQRDGRWCTAEVVERDVHRDGADLATWRVLIVGDEEEYEVHEFAGWLPLGK